MEDKIQKPLTPFTSLGLNSAFNSQLDGSPSSSSRFVIRRRAADLSHKRKSGTHSPSSPALSKSTSKPSPGRRNRHSVAARGSMSMRGSPDRLVEHFPNALTGVRTPSIVYSSAGDYVEAGNGRPLSPLMREAMGLERETIWVPARIEDLKTTVESTIETTAATKAVEAGATIRDGEKIVRKPVPARTQPNIRKPGLEDPSQDFCERRSTLDTGQFLPHLLQIESQNSLSTPKHHQFPKKSRLPKPLRSLVAYRETPTGGEGASITRTRISGFLRSNHVSSSRGPLDLHLSQRNSRFRSPFGITRMIESPSRLSIAQRKATDGTGNCGGHGHLSAKVTAVEAPIPAPSISTHISTFRSITQPQKRRLPRFLPSFVRDPVENMERTPHNRKSLPLHHAVGPHYNAGRGLAQVLSGDGPPIDEWTGKGLESWAISASRSAMGVPSAARDTRQTLVKVALEDRLLSPEHNLKLIPVRMHSLVEKKKELKGFSHFRSIIKTRNLLYPLLDTASDAAFRAYRTMAMEKPPKKDVIVALFSLSVLFGFLFILRWLLGWVVACISAFVATGRWFFFL